MTGHTKVELSNHCIANFETNAIQITMENESERITKVEPRIMRVLEILVQNSPNVVSRKQLIDEVWNNYGGADDALHQAVSHLRKILGDTDKENRLIETVVKKGYRYTGSIDSKATHMTDSKIFKKKWISIVVLIVIIGLATWIYISKEKDNDLSPVLAPASELDINAKPVIAGDTL